MWMTTRVGAALDSDVAAAEGFWGSDVDALWLTNGTLDKGNEDGQVRRRWLSRQGQAWLSEAGLGNRSLTITLREPPRQQQALPQ
ncbi:hypothetical protein CLAM6_15690 [Cobetia sp. AM6]|nr:hypothetical protein CLAM6_15690 [Cobetia sp. AM6]